MNEHDDELGAEERRAFQELPRELSPRSGVEDRIVSALRDRGRIRPGARRLNRYVSMGAVAAGLVLLAAGYVLGRSVPRPRTTPSAPRFALFLLRGEERLPERPEEEAGRVAEYRAWARGLASAGRLVTGEKLEDLGQRLGAVPAANATAPEEEIRGFFIISATDFEDALVVARGCPHLRHGGEILLRPIAPV
jgi:hypothetical protein